MPEKLPTQVEARQRQEERKMHYARAAHNGPHAPKSLISFISSVGNAVRARLRHEEGVKPELSKMINADAAPAEAPRVIEAKAYVENFPPRRSDEPFYVPDGLDVFPGWLNEQVDQRRKRGDDPAQWYIGAVGPDAADMIEAEGEAKKALDERAKTELDEVRRLFPHLDGDDDAAGVG